MAGEKLSYTEQYNKKRLTGWKIAKWLMLGIALLMIASAVFK